MVNGKEKCLQEHKLELAVGGKKRRKKKSTFFCGIQFILSIFPPPCPLNNLVGRSLFIHESDFRLSFTPAPCSQSSVQTLLSLSLSSRSALRTLHMELTDSDRKEESKSTTPHTDRLVCLCRAFHSTWLQKKPKNKQKKQPMQVTMNKSTESE